MAHLLSAERISLDYPTVRVLDEVTCGIDDGDRVGIVGRNGDGKSSLLALLAGRRAPSAGQVTRRGGLRVGYLSQADELPGAGAVEQVLFGQRPRYQWASDPAQRGVVDALLAGVGLEQDIGQLSGGERRKVALAQVLVGDWDILALDEPTNHLDLAAVWWLAGHLRTRWPSAKGALLVVTHDRWFLDEVVDTTWEVHDLTVDSFAGGYAAYTLARVERDRRAATAETRRRNLARKELAWLRRGPPARTSKPRFRIAEANALIADVPEARNQVSLARLAMSRLGKKVIDLEGVGFRYGSGPAVLADVTWRIAPGERSGILGANGAGKSTLLGLVAGRLAPTIGQVSQGKTVRIGQLDQSDGDLGPLGEDLVREVLARLKTTFEVEGKQLSAAQLLERLGFAPAHLSARVADLSGGQRRRLQILLVLCQEPNVLILDEPTNDVDTEMLIALEDLLDTWPGTVLVVSHDRYFIDRVTDQQYAVHQGGLRHLPGGIDQYLELTRPAAAAVPRRPGAPSASHRDRLARKQLAGLEAKLSGVEDRLAQLADRLAQADPADWPTLADLTAQLDQARADQADLEEQWLVAAEAVDAS